MHSIQGMNLTVWIPACAGMEIREGRMEGSAQKKDKGATDQTWNVTNLAGKRYSVGKVRMPAGLNNRISAYAVLSIEQQFCACQGENDTFFGGLRYQDWLKEEFQG